MTYNHVAMKIWWESGSELAAVVEMFSKFIRSGPNGLLLLKTIQCETNVH